MKYGEPHDKMRGLARLSDDTLGRLSLLSALSVVVGILIVLPLNLIWFSSTLALVAMAMFACGTIGVLTFGSTIEDRQRTWRPLLEPLTVTDVVMTTTASAAGNASDSSITYCVRFRETGTQLHEVMDRFDESIVIGSQVKGDIWLWGGQVRKLRVAPADTSEAVTS